MAGIIIINSFICDFIRIILYALILRYVMFFFHLLIDKYILIYYNINDVCTNICICFFFPPQKHTWYATKYWICEFMCLVNIVLQIYWMNIFFDGEFIHYGLRVIGLSEEHQDVRKDPMVYIFPRVTKCTFHKFGPSGTVQKHDSLCILPLNILNEKTYIFIWFWYLLLLIALVFMAAHRYLRYDKISNIFHPFEPPI